MEEIENLFKNWEKTPEHFNRVDLTSLVQGDPKKVEEEKKELGENSNLPPLPMPVRAVEKEAEKEIIEEEEVRRNNRIAWR